MNTDELVAHYVAFRRTLGERCEATEVILRAFCRSVGPKTPVACIGTDAVGAFLVGTGPVTGGWRGRYHALKGFFRFAVSRGHLGQAPLPAVLPKRFPDFVPHIYSRADLRRLLDAIRPDRRSRTSIEPQTLRAILLLLYGAGLRASEALNLSVADVDLPNAVLTVRDTKFFKSRLVPLGPQLTGVLTEYARWRAATHPSSGDEGRFFLGKRGAAVSLRALEGAFRRLRGAPRCTVPLTPASSPGCTTSGTPSRSTG
jgi:integrase